MEEERFEAGVGKFIERVGAGRGAGDARGDAVIGTVGEDVGVELEPEVGEGVGGGVVVSDGGGAGEGLLGVVEGGVDDVVGALLPIGVAGRAGGGALGVGRREELFELAEFIGGERLGRVGLGEQGRSQREGQRSGGEGKMHGVREPVACRVAKINDAFYARLGSGRTRRLGAKKAPTLRPALSGLER